MPKEKKVTTPAYKELKVPVTAEDMEGFILVSTDCPGYRSVKRIVPSLEQYGTDFGYARDKHGQTAVVIVISPEHAWERICRKEPFEMIIRVPVDVETVNA